MQRVLAAEHPDTLAARSSLASCLLYGGKHSEAEAEYRKELSGREHTQGPEHHDTNRCRYLLAMCLCSQHKTAEARKEAAAAHSGLWKVLGNLPADTNNAWALLHNLSNER